MHTETYKVLGGLARQKAAKADNSAQGSTQPFSQDTMNAAMQSGNQDELFAMLNQVAD